MQTGLCKNYSHRGAGKSCKLSRRLISCSKPELLEVVAGPVEAWVLQGVVESQEDG